MAKGKKERSADGMEQGGASLHPGTKKSIWAVVFVGLSLVFILARFGKAGPAGTYIYHAFETLLGAGYLLLPLVLLFAAGSLLLSEKPRVVSTTLLGAVLFLASFLGLAEIAAPGHGGWLGLVLGSLKTPLGDAAASIINCMLLVVGVLVTANISLDLRRFYVKDLGETPRGAGAGDEMAVEEAEQTKEPKRADKEKEGGAEKIEGEEEIAVAPQKEYKGKVGKGKIAAPLGDYTAPPLSLLQSGTERPTTGDLRANANIIKRTLESFGISVEMGEVNVGPKVTRYTLKPAEGMKLSRITALHQDLALALAAHPIRIEAPIPGKSLVGIEVPNKAAALVRLGNLMAYSDFQSSGPLSFAVGRDVTGEPIFADVERMPHLLIAGATGSGKSVAIHALITSLLYKNSPATLRLILIDPKRVELSVYEGLPHLIAPVITENKKAMGVFRWAISEMEHRYDILLEAGSRDIKSYNSSHGGEPLPFLVIVIDELADLMTSYGREVEGSVVRLAQMARATGIHLVLSTQRPSVEIITGLIKANITSRIAMQVASQIDSRTILDMSGAEKLLGGGDLLFVSAELSKPKRIQGAYITEQEINAVADFVRDHNKAAAESSEVQFNNGNNSNGTSAAANFDEYLDSDDELFDEAAAVVRDAKKASASLLQRRLKVGYARAARLLDLMEAKGLIGPGEGAKPREVFLEKFPQYPADE